MCDRDCWNCKHEGCVNLTNSDYKRQNDFDRTERLDRKLLNKRQITIYNYNHSYKAKNTRDKYTSTDKGKETNRKSTRAYYQRNKEYVRAMHKRYLDENREKVNARRRDYYQRNKETIKEKQKLAKAKSIWKVRYREKHGIEPSEIELEKWLENYLRKSG